MEAWRTLVNILFLPLVLPWLICSYSLCRYHPVLGKGTHHIASLGEDQSPAWSWYEIDVAFAQLWSWKPVNQISPENHLPSCRRHLHFLPQHVRSAQTVVTWSPTGWLTGTFGHLGPEWGMLALKCLCASWCWPCPGSWTAAFLLCYLMQVEKALWSLCVIRTPTPSWGSTPMTSSKHHCIPKTSPPSNTIIWASQAFKDMSFGGT